MNALLCASSGVFAPVRALMRRFSVAQRFEARPGTVTRFKAGRPDRPLPAPLAATALRHGQHSPVLARSRNSLPLRVIRVVDGDHPTPHGGRMVISGRMADVCAELDRMAAREDQALAPAR